MQGRGWYGTQGSFVGKKAMMMAPFVSSPPSNPLPHIYCLLKGIGRVGGFAGAGCTVRTV